RDLATDPAADRAPHDLLELVGVRGPLAGRLLEGGDDLRLDLGEDLVVLGEAACGDLRPGDDLPGRGVDDAHDGDEALLPLDPAVLEHVLLGLADTRAVDVDVPARHRAGDPRPAVDEVDDDAVLGEHDPVGVYTGGDGQLAVGDEMTPLPVDRHDVAGPDDVVAVQEFPGAGMAGDVDLGVALVHDVGAESHQAVDDAVDGVLVAGDQARGEQHGVALADVDAVVPVGHPRQCGHRLALAAGAHEDDLVV